VSGIHPRCSAWQTREIGRLRNIRGLPCLRLTALILVVGYPNHGGMNQKVRDHHPRCSNWCLWYQIKSQWKLERDHDGWTLRGLETGLYVGVEDRSTSNGAKVVAVKDKSIWYIQRDEKSNQHFRYLSLPSFQCGWAIIHYISRIFTPNVKKNLDLSNHGKGPDIEIWGHWEGLNQLWIFDEGKLNVSALK